jgi:hypothetical protein
MTHMHDQNMSNFFYVWHVWFIGSFKYDFFWYLYIYLAKKYFTVVFVYVVAAAFRLKHSSFMFG